MNLCDRLHTKAPIYAWGKYHFRYAGQTHEGKSALVWMVAERFARRFGVIDGACADRIYDRLARKYCNQPGNVAVFNSLSFGYSGRSHIAHPVSRAQIDRQDRQQAFIKDQEHLAVLRSVADATMYAEGAYCVAASAKYPCRVCNQPMQHESVFSRVTRTIFHGRDGVCLHTRCQALRALFPKAFNSRKYYQFPVLLILQEITKNANNYDTHQRGLALHFVRHAGQVHKWQARCRISKDGRQAGRQPAEIGGR